MSKLSTLSRKKKISLIAIVTAVVLVGAGIGWLLQSGWLVVTLERPNNRSVAVYPVVCDTPIVKKYNDAMYFAVRGTDTESSIDKPALGTLVADITANKKHTEDATCQAIIFWTAIVNGDAAAASEAYDAVEALHAKRSFVDNNLSGDQSLNRFSSQLSALVQPTDEDANAGQ